MDFMDTSIGNQCTLICFIKTAVSTLSCNKTYFTVQQVQTVKKNIFWLFMVELYANKTEANLAFCAVRTSCVCLTNKDSLYSS